MHKTMDALETLRRRQAEMNTVYKPIFLRLQQLDDRKKFESLLETPGISVVDYFNDQVKELIKIKRPDRKFSTEALAEEMKLFIGTTNPDIMGVWVYYPWSARMVHLLDEEDFITVRTSRNQYKITPAEKETLSKKKIGVIGLSVGQSVSVTLAMERICTELRLADFDILELTNLNRIRTGVHNLGLPKVYSVAREIAEIDPFIKVICFADGLHDGNMDTFFTGGGKLDLLVEESDGFDIKILSRYKARELKIPVIMEGSDRCLVDVERFDLEPGRDILHGLVNHLDIGILKTLKTNEQKIPYMLDVIGIEDSSLRLKASMLEIEQSITTWPQLASAVTMGGGITADVSRRILLNQFTDSGRYHVDVEELIGHQKLTPATRRAVTPPTTLSLAHFNKKTETLGRAGNLALERRTIETLVAAGCCAPSGGNSQPWRWIYRNNRLFLFNAFDGGGTLLGYGNNANYVALGAAAQNVMLKARQMGLHATLGIFPEKDVPDLVATFDFTAGAPGAHDILAEAIGKRVTNRTLGKRQRIDDALLAELTRNASRTEGVKLRFFTSQDELFQIGDLLGELEKTRLLDEIGHRDFVSEIRWTEEENNRTRDGIDIRTLDISNSERVGLEIACDGRLIDMLNAWHGGGAFKKLTRKAIDAAGAVGFITINEKGPASYVRGGMALESVWLNATARGLAFQPVSASLFMFARFLQAKGAGFSGHTVESLGALRQRFEAVFGAPGDTTEIFIFRLAISAEPAVKSLRKPMEELFYFE